MKFSLTISESMKKEKFKKEFEGKLKDLINFFDLKYKGETFECAFQGRKQLNIGEQIYSYDFIYILYHGKDERYILFERIL